MCMYIDVRKTKDRLTSTFMWPQRSVTSVDNSLEVLLHVNTKASKLQLHQISQQVGATVTKIHREIVCEQIMPLTSRQKRTDIYVSKWVKYGFYTGGQTLALAVLSRYTLASLWQLSITPSLLGADLSFTGYKSGPVQTMQWIYQPNSCKYQTRLYYLGDLDWASQQFVRV